jgi:hypothetical protein
MVLQQPGMPARARATEWATELANHRKDLPSSNA